MTDADDLTSDLPALLRRAAHALWGQSAESPTELGRILMGRAIRLEDAKHAALRVGRSRGRDAPEVNP